LIAVAVQGIGTDALEDTLAAGSGWGAEELAALAATRPLWFRQAFIRSLRMEESYFVLFANLENPATLMGAALGDESLGQIAGPSVMSSLYRIYFLPEDIRSRSEWMSRARDLLQRGQVTRRYWEALQESLAASRKGPLASIALPSFMRSAQSVIGADARARLAQLAVAVTAYELKNRRYPASLDDLVPGFITGVPVDPFDQKPLRMTATDDELVLYSIGYDGIDDDGMEKHRESDYNDGDLTFCLGPAYAARGRGTPK
jgi:hypothetical protein